MLVRRRDGARPGPLTELDARSGQGERGMRTVVASGSAAGPFSAPLLARPGHEGIVVDRDAPSPAREADSAESAE